MIVKEDDFCTFVVNILISELCNGHRCVVNAYCDVTQHCKCKNGYHGDGLTHCESKH
jgi:hypothetical protein